MYILTKNITIIKDMETGIEMDYDEKMYPFPTPVVMKALDENEFLKTDAEFVTKWQKVDEDAYQRWIYTKAGLEIFEFVEGGFEI